VVKVTDLEKMVERHIEETPALSLNGRVVVSGRVPSKEELEDIIRRTLGGARHG
jgi:predicted DsbA family dithiol-disulfide isomerase